MHRRFSTMNDAGGSDRTDFITRLTYPYRDPSRISITFVPLTEIRPGCHHLPLRLWYTHILGCVRRLLRLPLCATSTAQRIGRKPPVFNRSFRRQRGAPRSPPSSGHCGLHRVIPAAVPPLLPTAAGVGGG